MSKQFTVKRIMISAVGALGVFGLSLAIGAQITDHLLRASGLTGLGWNSTPAANYTLPQKNFRQAHEYPGGSFFLELNGDGLPDIYADPDGYQAYLNNGDGTFRAIAWNKPFSERLYNSPAGSAEAILLDINGDQLTDALVGYAVYLSNGSSGWVRAAEWDLPIGGGGDGRCQACRAADVNADGLVDFVYSLLRPASGTTPDSYEKKISLNTGSGWTVINADTAIPVAFGVYGGGGLNYELIDINGDGLADIVDLVRTGNVYLNIGALNWQTAPNSTWFITDSMRQINFSHVLTGQNLMPWRQRILRFADVNADGLPDIIKSYREMDSARPEQSIMDQNEIYLNTGNGWQLASDWKAPKWFVVFDNHNPNGAPIDLADLEAVIADINADNLPDIIESYYGADPHDGPDPNSPTRYIYRWHQAVYLGKGGE